MGSSNCDKIIPMILTVLMTAQWLSAYASSDTIEGAPIAINANQKTFLQAIQLVANHTNVSIDIRGSNPPGLRDVSIAEPSIEQAVKWTLRRYGVTNYGIIYHSGNDKRIEVIILDSQFEKEQSSFQLVGSTSVTDDDDKMLSYEEFQRLPESEQNGETFLSYKIFLQLEEDTNEIEKTLTQEEFLVVVSEPEVEDKHLTGSEFNRLLN